MFKRLLTTALVFGAVATAPPVFAQQATCGQRDHLTAQLTEKYMEQLTAGGFQSASSVLEIWTSPQSGTWTMLLTRPDGVSCVVGSGTAWQMRDVMPEPEGLPS
ncbi:MAG: hypothetical protein ACE5DK_04550 [Paracoccaceae bacterium]